MATSFNEAPPTPPGTPASYGFWSIYNKAADKYKADMAAYNERKATYEATLAATATPQAAVDPAKDMVTEALKAKVDELAAAANTKSNDLTAITSKAIKSRTSLETLAARVVRKQAGVVTPTAVLNKTQLGGIDEPK